MKKLNNKGYMLVEIILAFAIALGVAFFLSELTIKLKNKNDDLLVKTLVYTDQAIIYNEIMDDFYNGGVYNYCDKLNIDKGKRKITYGTSTPLIVSEYAQIGTHGCSYNEVDDNSAGTKTITLDLTINISVKQLPEEDFNVKIYQKKVLRIT